MAERAPYLEPVNLGLGVALGLLVLAAGVAFLGPGRAQLRGLGLELASGAARSAHWQQERRGLLQVGNAEREQWARQWESLVTRVPLAVDDPTLLARLAGAFPGPGVRGLEIDRLAATPEDPAPEPLALLSPGEAAEATLEGDPVRVRFRAGYPRLAQLLRELEAGALPARLEALEVRRGAGELAVELTLTVFARREVRS